jgi:hypothetical protein
MLPLNDCENGNKMSGNHHVLIIQTKDDEGKNITEPLTTTVISKASYTNN